MKWMAQAHEVLENFMKSQIDERREELRGESGANRRDDVFSLMLQANEVDDENAGSKHTLDDQELVGCLHFSDLSPR